MSSHKSKFDSRAVAMAARLEDEIKISRVMDVGPVRIYTVNGRVIRDNVFIDFTEGGNSAKYKWMPSNTIYLDHDVDPEEVRFVMLHELHEFNRMHEGLGYERAHDSANSVEQAARDGAPFADLWGAEVTKLMAWASRGQKTTH